MARLLLVFDYLESAPPPRNLQDVLALAGMKSSDIVRDQNRAETLSLPDAILTRQDMVIGLGLVSLSILALGVGQTI